jgi:ubiquitin carboxyl-terminal hydrolase 2/21
MRFLVSGLHEELKKETRDKPTVPQEPDPEQWWMWYRELEKSRLVDVFVGQLRSSLTCGTCGHCSVTFDPFWELSVSLPTRRSFSTTTYSSYHGVGYSTGGSSSSGTRLEDCLKIFTEEERLDGDEQPYCEKCRCQEPGVKKMTIQRLPPVLVIHLKRFSSYGRRSKLDTSVTIPHTLNVSDYTTRGPSCDVSDKQYELYGVSNHSGTVYFGHYTAWCKHYSSNKWFSYNDSQVSPLTVQTPTFSSSAAYVLFYRRSGKLTTRC